MGFGGCGCSGLPTPFGGPGSGLWPSGGGAPAAPPPPPASPIVASILADCFGGCAGVITQATPGPVCGWEFFQSLLGAAGPVVLTPGMMTFEAPTSQEAPAAYKDLVMPSLYDMTIQFQFQEFSDLMGSAVYILVLTDAGQANVVSITLGANGDFTVLTGPQANGTVYLGNWTPNMGQHTVQVTTDALGVPRAWVDGVEITLALNQTGLVFSGYPEAAVTVNFADLNGPGPAVSATLTRLFITTGQLPPTQAFACP